MVRTLIGGGEAEGGADARGDAVNEAVTLLNTLIAGDPVILPLPLASRDPGAYPDLTEVRLDRSTVKHVAFGLRPHRCIGSHLARLEMRLAFDEWHVRIPDYRIDGDVMGYGGAVMGVTTLPFTWA